MTDLIPAPPLEAAEPPRVSLGNDSVVPAQPPLTDRETLGFYQAMQAEREKRHTLEKELAELKTKSAGERDESAQRIEAALRANTLKVSRRFAEQTHGKARIDEIHHWAIARCDSDPAFNGQMHASDDPYEAAREAYEREVSASAPANPLSALVPPPRSLANVPGEGGAAKAHTPIGEGNAYAAIFN